MHRFNKFVSAVKCNPVLFCLFYPVVYARRIILWLGMSPFEKYYDQFYKYTFDSVEDGSLLVRVSEFDGVFEIGIKSHLLRRVLRNKHYEPELAEIVKAHVDPTKDVLDIGANIGFFSVLCSRLISKKNKVFAIEPTPLALKYLRKNLKRNECLSSVVIFEGVMTDKEGMVSFNIVPGMEEYSSLGDIVEASIGSSSHIESIKVCGSTVDKLISENMIVPGFIKIDTEGAEFLVLSGAMQTLKRYRPVILSELSDNYLATLGHSAESVINLLINSGYRVLNATRPEAPIRYPFVGEILAVPVERI